MQTQRVVDVQIERGGQDGFAANAGERSRHKAGLSREIGAPLNTAKMQRTTPAADAADGVAHAQTGEPFGPILRERGVQANQVGVIGLTRTQRGSRGLTPAVERPDLEQAIECHRVSGHITGRVRGDHVII